MWVLIAIGVIIVILGLVVIIAMRKGKTPLEPMSVGMAAGGIVGVVVGIALVELAGFEYPVPAITWMLGMAAGQVIGFLYRRGKQRRQVY